MEETAKNKKIEEDKITELKQRKDTLTSEIAKLKTEKGVEENIREKFGWVKDGEDMIVVVDDNEQTNSNNTTQVNGFLSFFRKIFK
jgi:cell division protein FtsB